MSRLHVTVDPGYFYSDYLISVHKDTDIQVESWNDVHLTIGFNGPSQRFVVVLDGGEFERLYGELALVARERKVAVDGGDLA
ncbi:hypothetical protein [Crossiella sp. S99.1]|uniref:hypothetical protein n=1 Tax=Crossiella sp. S99.1 TaxID=2936271 RepID=UPI001FFE658B|nr:hypothetical protein [Crossiella sp. S99.1]MCK2257049.1 hypothetical protein [Crossiella sp. S99.1]